MVAIKKKHFTGGAKLTPDGGARDDLAEILRDISDDLLAMKGDAAVARGNALVVDIADLRTKFIAALGALDGDSGVSATDYAATQSPAALTATAIVSSSQVVAQLNALVADDVAIRAKIITALAKLDGDAGVADTNYAALWTPPALTAAVITSLSGAAALINKLLADRAAMKTALAGAYAKLDADGTVNLTTYAATYTPVAPTAGTLSVLLTSKAD